MKYKEVRYTPITYDEILEFVPPAFFQQAFVVLSEKTLYHRIAVSNKPEEMDETPHIRIEFMMQDENDDPDEEYITRIAEFEPPDDILEDDQLIANATYFLILRALKLTPSDLVVAV